MDRAAIPSGGGWCAPEPAALVREMIAAAEAALSFGDTDTALAVLEAATVTLIDEIDPERAGTGLRLVPLPMPRDGMIDLPEVRLSREERPPPPSDAAVMGPIIEAAGDAWRRP